jgi:hypothetical protein
MPAHNQKEPILVEGQWIGTFKLRTTPSVTKIRKSVFYFISILQIRSSGIRIISVHKEYMEDVKDIIIYNIPLRYNINASDKPCL